MLCCHLSILNTLLWRICSVVGSVERIVVGYRHWPADVRPRHVELERRDVEVAAVNLILKLPSVFGLSE